MSEPAISHETRSERRYDPELHTRRELVTFFKDDAIGTVGILGPIDMNDGLKRDFRTNAATKGREIKLPPDEGGGWFAVGDVEGAKAIYNPKLPRDIEGVPNPNVQGNRDNLYFLLQEDSDRIHVVYVFADEGYVDSTGRPSELNVGFLLPAESAKAFAGFVHDDPSFLDEVITAQVIETGFPEKKWHHVPQGPDDLPSKEPVGVLVEPTSLEKEDKRKLHIVIPTLDRTGFTAGHIPRDRRKRLGYFARNYPGIFNALDPAPEAQPAEPEEDHVTADTPPVYHALRAEALGKKRPPTRAEYKAMLASKLDK